VNVEPALLAVEREVLELAFEIGLHLEEFEPEHLRVGDERIGPTMPDLDRLVDEVIGFSRLLGDGVDGRLSDHLEIGAPRVVWPAPSRPGSVVGSGW
jgi:hypothetical protein